MGFEVSKSHSRPSLALSDSDVWIPHKLLAMLPATTIMDCNPLFTSTEQ